MFSYGPLHTDVQVLDDQLELIYSSTEVMDDRDEWQERVKEICASPIYPTPPLGQDMTQGQFLSEV